MTRYIRELQKHHGTPVACFLTVLGFAAGAGRENWLIGGLVGASIMSIYWVPVLWSANHERRATNAPAQP